MKEGMRRNIHVLLPDANAQYMRLILSTVNFLLLVIVCTLIRQTLLSVICKARILVVGARVHVKEDTLRRRGLHDLSFRNLT
jgi:hypothetical protein